MHTLKQLPQYRPNLHAVSLAGVRYGAIATLICAMLQSAFAADTLTTWMFSTPVTLNTSFSGANVATSQINFPVLLRLTSSNAAAVFAMARSDGGDLRFSRAGDTGQLPYEIGSYDPVTMRAAVWVKTDSVQGNNANQSILMWWGKSSASTTSNPSGVFAPANGFAMVLHLDSRSTGTTMHDATGQGNNGTCSNSVTDTDGVFGRAVALHCYGSSASYIAGDSITIAGLLGEPAQVTLSAWVRVDSIDQANTSANGHLACIMSMGDYASMNDAGASGTGTDSLCTGWFGTGSQWNNYGWPSKSLSGTSLNGLPNSAGQAMLHQGWRYAAVVINPPGGFTNVYLDGDSLRSAPASNALDWTGGNNGKRTVIGKHGGGHAGLKFGGSVAEARIENVARSSNWIKLCYENQQPFDSLTSLNALALGTPMLSLPPNGASGIPLTPTLDWSAAALATSYGVQVSTDVQFGSTIFEASNLSSTFAAPAGLANATTCYWRADATNSAGTSAWSNVWSFTTAFVKPAAPAPVSPKNGIATAQLNVNLAWSAVTTASSYTVEISTSANFSTTVFAQSGIEATLVPAGGLAYSSFYYWQVSAVNSGGSSTWSAVWSFGTMATAVQPNSNQRVAKTVFNVTSDALAYSLPSSGRIEIMFTNLLGRTVLSVNRTQAAGSYTMSLHDQILTSGCYLIHFKTAGLEKNVMMMISK